MKQTDSSFEQWYNGMVGFHINSERMINDLAGRKAKDLSPALRKWMAVCWNEAIDAAKDEFCSHCGNYIGTTLNQLKEPLDKLL